MTENSRQDKIKLGAFIALVLAAGLGVLIFFVGVSLGEDTKSYTVYFTQSVTGLTPGSQVTLNGVRVGEVQDIAVDTENVERVVVTLSVLEGTPVKVDTEAFLSNQGITGLKYVDLQGSTHEAEALKADSVIPTGQGLLDRLTARADDVTASADQIVAQLALLVRDENIKRLDELVIQGVEMVSTANATLRELNKALVVVRELLERNEEEIDRTLRNVSVASGKLDGLLSEARVTLQSGRDKLDQADVAALTAGLLQTNDAVRSKIEQLDVASLIQTIAAFQGLLGELTTSVGQNQNELKVMMNNMRRTTDNLQALSREVREKPSSLVFDRAPREREVPDAK